MIYKEVFDLRGTEKQQQIVKEALDQIKFPFERIRFPKGYAVIGWANLNGQALVAPSDLAEALKKAGGEVTIVPTETSDGTRGDLEEGTTRSHEGDHPASDADVEPLEAEVNGRKYTLGVFYPSSGNIYIDNALVNYPYWAQTTVSAEVAHGVDEFLPLTEAQRQEIIRLLHDNDPDPSHRQNDHTDRWWELYDYGAEYYNLIGESFMIMFTYAYSDMDFEGATDFFHEGTPELGKDIRRIMGIERTDYVAPAPAPEPVPEPTPEPEPVVEPSLPPVEEPVVEPEPTPEVPAEPTPETPVEPTPEPTEPTPAPVEPTPEPTPTPEDGGSPSVPDTDVGSGDDGGTDTPVQEFVRYGKSKVYHIPDHYEKKTNGKPVEDTEGLRLCKICARLIERAR